MKLFNICAKENNKYIDPIGYNCCMGQMVRKLLLVNAQFVTSKNKKE